LLHPDRPRVQVAVALEVIQAQVEAAQVLQVVVEVTAHLVALLQEVIRIRVHRVVQKITAIHLQLLPRVKITRTLLQVVQERTEVILTTILTNHLHQHINQIIQKVWKKQ
jgi:hypothetical protein